MKITILTAVLLMISSALFAQNIYSVKGSVTDTASNSKLINTTISVLKAKDSTLVKFTRAAADGSFSIPNLSTGSFILLVTYPGYADYVEKFTLDSINTSRNFGPLNMILKSNLLASILIKGTVAAIKIKGDTTEYNAAAFKIQPNAKVEDLLKQLPGIQVDKDGKITAQGETVSKVLVDGEEFFGDDPTLVTKNLRGDMVDKVQLYDKKSDQATFTGIDDGVKTKTINIKLKEDKKNGYFGKVDAGSADGEYYQGQGMFNAFKAKRKASAYITVANTGKVGLGWEDSNKYGSSGNMQVSDDGGLMYTGGGDDLYYNGQGIPSAKTGGAHYDGKWNKDKESINMNYKAGALSIDGVRSNISQSTLPDPSGVQTSTGRNFYNNDNQVFGNSTFRQKLDATYELKIDSASNLKVAVDGTIRNTKSNSNNISLNNRDNNIKQNDANRTQSSDGNQQSFNANIFYNRKFKKVGRTFSINLNQAYTKGEDEGFLYTKINYYDQLGTFSRDSVLDQFKTTNSLNSRLNTNVTYTEPFSKTFSVVLNTGFNMNNSTSHRKSFNKDAGGQYSDLDEVFSNNFEYNQFSNQGGAVFNYKKNKTIVNFGTKVDAVNLNQRDLYTDKLFDRHFININPQASYQYRFSQQRSVRISYNGSTQQPGISQIQPVRVNTDPLNISLGNPDLEASFNSSFNTSYSSYKVLTNQYLYFRGSYSFTVNQIVPFTNTNYETGGSVYKSVNLDNQASSNFNFNGGFEKKIKALGFNAGFNVSANGRTGFNYINENLNKLESNTYSVGLNVSNYVAKKYGFYASFKPRYTTNRSTLQGSNNNGGGLTSDGAFTIYLPGKWEIVSDFRYTLTQKTSAFSDDVEYFIVNSSVSKKFMKDEGLRISLSGNDLLNQNIGFNRNAYGNSISQNSYTTIKRFFLLSLIWDFNKMGGGVKAPAK